MGTHLAAGQGMLGVVLEAGVVDPADLGVGRQIRRHRLAITAVAQHAHAEGLQVLQHEEGILRGNHRPEKLRCVPADILDQRLRPDDGTANHGGVAGQKFGEGEQYDVGPERHGLLKGGGGGGVVHHQRYPLGVGHLGNRRNVGDKERRVAGGFDPDHLGALVHQFSPGGRIGRRLHKAEVDVAAFREDGGGLLVALAEDVQAGDHIVSGPGDGEDQIEEGLRAGAGGDASFAPLEGRQALLQHGIGGRAGAAVYRAGDLGEILVGKGHGLDDGRHERTKRRHGFGWIETGVQGAGVEAQVGVAWRRFWCLGVVNPGIAHEELVGVGHSMVSFTGIGVNREFLPLSIAIGWIAIWGWSAPPAGLT